ncbi:ArsR/SmtB family transcription factor [Streptomyces sp. 1331.2]|uniref:ArsR/SmtB family transcription factor n=1 Tax=Streptomyces sp. 1331.2 TaxID=1938835 RepID=UPI000BD034B8|nr:metalloregulator ArsR/SmtB family transcription factor [Streptomyces sp. 1331.2]SOB86175.1 Helix-turn-helix domain-containing protein [Streptomyces sp. 1331.2]
MVAVDQLSRAFVALADPTRRDIVARLSVRDATVGELAESYAMSMQAVSKHLKVLEEAGLVSRSRDGQRRPCHLEPQVFDLMTNWIERYRRQAEERFSRLDALLADLAEAEVESETVSEVESEVESGSDMDSDRTERTEGEHEHNEGVPS